MFKEFKEFAMKGNLIDLAVGFVMGAAFVKVTGAFIDGIVMPLVGLLQGKDLSQWKAVIKPEVKDAAGVIIAPEVAIKYGTFIGVSIEFLIVAFVMFIVVKGVNKLKKAEPPASPAAPAPEVTLLTEIRDLLRK
jgi:large conductance mechanosensitive channel